MASTRPVPSCPRCGGTMEPGYMIDQSFRSRRVVPTWAPGQPLKSIWLGLKVRKRDQLAVTTYRCGGCGYLESYA